MYELIFKGESSREFRRLVLFRPFGPLMKVRSDRVDAASIPINIVVPLSRRSDKFKQFMHNFRWDRLALLRAFRGRHLTTNPAEAFIGGKKISSAALGFSTCG